MRNSAMHSLLKTVMLVVLSLGSIHWVYAGCTGSCVKASGCQTVIELGKAAPACPSTPLYTCRGGISMSYACYTDSNCDTKADSALHCKP